LLSIQKFEDVFAGILAVEPAPSAGPIVMRIVIGHALPVAPCELGRIVDAQPALVRRADHMHAAERFFGEPAEVFAPFLIDQQDAPATAEQLVRGHNACQPAAGNDDFGLHLVAEERVLEDPRRPAGLPHNYVPSDQLDRYRSCSGVSRSIFTPMDSSFMRATCLSRSSGTE